jgi:hypothetical protein
MARWVCGADDRQPCGGELSILIPISVLTHEHRLPSSSPLELSSPPTPSHTLTSFGQSVVVAAPLVASLSSSSSSIPNALMSSLGL